MNLLNLFKRKHKAENNNIPLCMIERMKSGDANDKFIDEKCLMCTDLVVCQTLKPIMAGRLQAMAKLGIDGTKVFYK